MWHMFSGAGDIKLWSFVVLNVTENITSIILLNLTWFMYIGVQTRLEVGSNSSHHIRYHNIQREKENHVFLYLFFRTEETLFTNFPADIPLYLSSQSQVMCPCQTSSLAKGMRPLDGADPSGSTLGSMNAVAIPSSHGRRVDKMSSGKRTEFY